MTTKTISKPEGENIMRCGASVFKWLLPLIIIFTTALAPAYGDDELEYTISGGEESVYLSMFYFDTFDCNCYSAVRKLYFGYHNFSYDYNGNYDCWKGSLDYKTSSFIRDSINSIQYWPVIHEDIHNGNFVCHEVYILGEHGFAWSLNFDYLNRGDYDWLTGINYFVHQNANRIFSLYTSPGLRTAKLLVPDIRCTGPNNSHNYGYNYHSFIFVSVQPNRLGRGD